MRDVDAYIQWCRRIAAIFDEELPDTAIEPLAHRRGGINPYYNRTASGLYLEFYYGYPSKVWTPGGYWAMTGSTTTAPFVDKDALVQRFLQRLTTWLHEPETQTKWGSHGPVYAILEIDGEPIDEPGDVAHFSKDGYAEIKTAWADLATGWQRLANR